jgi:hypothetical protein
MTAAALALLLALETASAGKYQVTLRLPPDGLFAREENEIEMRIADSSRPDPLLGASPVIRARVEARITMPSMPGMPAYRETAHPEGVPGDYGIHPTFAHGGEYLLHLSVAPPAGEPFAIEFPLRVDDPGPRRKPRPPRYSIEISSSPKSPKAGEPVLLRLIVRDREQPRAPVSSFDIAHERPMHLALVRDDLTQFAPEHPQVASSGEFTLRTTFAEGGDYRLFADVAPSGAGSQTLRAKLKVSGKRSAGANIWADRALARRNGSLAIELKPSRHPLPAGAGAWIEFTARDAATGAGAELEDYLGARGHLMMIHQDAATFVHSHPDGSRFAVRAPKPGLYRAWLQVQQGGAVLTTEFVLEAGLRE